MDRLFGRRPPDDASEDADADAVGRLGLPRPASRESTDPPWDRPADDRPEHRALDARADGPAWDRPSDDDFAPRPDPQLHWAFRDQPAPPAAAPSAAPAGGDDAPDEPPPTVALDPAWNLEYDARLVTAAGGEPSATPRDPAQPGMFDPYDAFAPVVDEPWWGPEMPVEPPWPEVPSRLQALPISAAPPPSTTPSAPLDTPPPPLALPSLAPPSLARSAPASPARAAGRRSVFGDFFAEAAARPADEALAAFAAPGPAHPPLRDPVEWPPIPTDLRPDLPTAATPPTEPDGRRFEWPPPQPRVAAPPEPAAPVSAAPSPPADQATLWPSHPPPSPPSEPRDAAPGEPGPTAALPEPPPAEASPAARLAGAANEPTPAPPEERAMASDLAMAYDEPVAAARLEEQRSAPAEPRDAFFAAPPASVNNAVLAVVAAGMIILAAVLLLARFVAPLIG